MTSLVLLLDSRSTEEKKCEIEGLQGWAAIAMIVFALATLGLGGMVLRSDQLVHVLLWGAGAIFCAMLTVFAMVAMGNTQRDLRLLEDEG